MNRHDFQDLGGGTVQGLLPSRAGWAPNNLYLVFEGRTWIYGEMDAEASVVASGLMALGIAPGAVAAAFMTNRPENLLACRAFGTRCARRRRRSSAAWAPSCTCC